MSEATNFGDEDHLQMAPRCVRCDEQHNEDDPRACPMVRSVEFDDYGVVKHIEYFGLAGIHTPVTEPGALLAPSPPTWRERTAIGLAEGLGSACGWLTVGGLTLVMWKMWDGLLR